MPKEPRKKFVIYNKINIINCQNMVKNEFSITPSDVVTN